MADDLRCPGCGRHYPDTMRVCVNCGIYLRTGQPVQTHIEPPAPAPETETNNNEPRIGPFRYAIAFILACLPGLTKPGILIVSLLLTVIGFVLIGGAFFMFAAFMLIFSAGAMGAIGLIAYAQAICLMVLGEFQIIHDALAEFTSAQWNIFLACLFAPVALCGTIVYLATHTNLFAG